MQENSPYEGGVLDLASKPSSTRLSCVLDDGLQHKVGQGQPVPAIELNKVVPEKSGDVRQE